MFHLFHRKPKVKKVLWLATNNPNKATEFRSILKGWTIWTLQDLKEPLDIKETGKTYEENALIKAKALAERVHGPAIGEDSGLEVKGLKGFPGIYSKRWAAPVTDSNKINAMLLDKMEKAGLTKKNQRDAEFITTICYYDPAKKEDKFFTGKVGGEIVDRPRGASTFGYDPIFRPYRHDETFAQMDPELKNKISHRRTAIEKLKGYLNNTFPGMTLINLVLLWVFSGED